VAGSQFFISAMAGLWGKRRKLSRHTNLSPETKHGKNQLSVAIQIDKWRKSVLSRWIKLLAVREAEGVDFLRIIVNDQLVWVVSVTRRSHPIGSWYFSNKIVPVARRVWRNFFKVPAKGISVKCTFICHEPTVTDLVNEWKVLSYYESVQMEKKIATSLLPIPAC